MSNYSVSLVGPAPWGFRLQGGKDFNMPLTISRLTDGGKAAKANIGIGDLVLSIDGISTDGMTHLEAQNKIKACPGSLSLNLQKASAAPKTNATPPQTPASYNSAVNLYASEAAQDGADMHRRGHVESQNGNPPPRRPPRKHIVDTESDFYHTPTFSDASKKRLVDQTEDWHPRTGTTQSRSFRILAQITGTENMSEPEPEEVKKNKDCKIVNGEISSSSGLPDKTEGQVFLANPAMCSMATQTEEVLHLTDEATPISPLPRSKPESIEGVETEETAQGSAPINFSDKPATVSGLKDNPHSRKAMFENPLESLPKGAPFPPATIRTLNASSQVATISKTSSLYMRSTTIVPVTKAEDKYVETIVANEQVSNTGVKERSTVSTQTDVLPPSKVLSPCATHQSIPASAASLVVSRHVGTSCSSVQTSLIQESSLYSQSSFVQGSLAQASVTTKNKLIENPLEKLPKAAPCPAKAPAPTTVQSSKSKTNAVAAVAAIVGAQARLSDPFVYRSLLDALLIDPVIKPSFPNSKPARRSTGVLTSEPSASGSLETTPSAPYTVAPAKNMPASYKSAPTAFKPSGSASTGKPGWQPAPSTGRISSQPSSRPQAGNPKPYAPPPLADQDTLFQRAEHIPAGTRTPVCATCNQVIRGPFLLALGKSWHPEEFNCAHCKKNMAEMGFVQEKGSYYCEICYEKFFAPDCARCQRKILGEVINALKQTWHVSCFVCVACHNPIRNNVFHLEDGDPYCETDYYSLFGTMCHGCEFPIEAGDKFLEAIGHTWHDTCFVCSVCCESLEGQTFFAKKDKPLCKKHAHAVNF